MKINEIAFAKSLGFLAGVSYTVCVLGFWLFSRFTMGLFDLWFHGVDLTALPIKTGGVGSVIVGLVSFTLLGWVSGLIMARSYNKFNK